MDIVGMDTNKLQKTSKLPVPGLRRGGTGTTHVVSEVFVVGDVRFFQGTWVQHGPPVAFHVRWMVESPERPLANTYRDLS